MDRQPSSPPAQPALQPVPMLDLRRQYAQVRAAVLEALERVCASQHFVLGEEVAAFEREAAAFLGSAPPRSAGPGKCEALRAVGCASGTDALWLALQALDLKPGDAVLTTPFSFFASVSTIVRAGCRPVLADIDPLTLNLDPAQVEARLREDNAVRAIMPVHLYGQCADMDALGRLAARHRLHIVEDAAQAFGAAWNGVGAGALGDAAGFSFYPTKNLSAYGDGGLVTTSDAGVAERVTRLRNHGSRERYRHEEIGWNSRLDALQAAVLRVKLNYLEQWNQARRERAAVYDRLLAETGLLPREPSAAISKQTPVQLLTTRPEAHHIYHQYVVRAGRRDELRSFLTQRGIGSEIYYPIPLHLQSCFSYLGYREGCLPVAEGAAREVLALPMFPELTEEEQRRVVAAIADFYA